MNASCPSRLLAILLGLICAVCAPGNAADIGKNVASVLASSPTVSSISPNIGALSGSQTVTITGTGFVAGSTSVTINTLSATNVSVSSSTAMTCDVPANNPGTYDVVVTVVSMGTGTLTLGYTYIPAPTVSSISPNSGSAAGGQTVTISGNNFVAGSTSVQFDAAHQGPAATNVNVISQTSLTCTTPAHNAGTVDIKVTSTGGAVIKSSYYTYIALPAFTSVAPNMGPVSGGTNVTITGSDFASGATVTFAGTAATNIVVVDSATITCTTSAHVSGTADIAITTAGGTGTGSSAFVYLAAPTVVSVSPNVGTIAGGTAVTITGSAYVNGVTITFDGITATGVVVVNTTTLTCITPSHSAGPVAIVVATPGGSVMLAGGYYFADGPTISSTNNTAFNVEIAAMFLVTSTGVPSGAIALAGALPSGFNFVDNGDGTATISGTPAAGTAGVYNLTLTATNPGGSASQIFVLTVIASTPVVGSGLDSDGDGFSDVFEMANGSNPLDPSSTPFNGTKITSSRSRY